MIDERGCFVQADGDGGDSAHRTATMAVCMHYFPPQQHTGALLCKTLVNILSRDRGFNFIRHWDTTKFWPDGKQIADPKHFSRDQASRVALAFAVCGQTDFLFRWLLGRVNNWGLHQNGDLPGIGEFGNIIRGFNAWFLYPLLLILDLRFIGDLYFRTKQKWDYDTLMLPDLYFAKEKLSTPWVWLAVILYRRTDFKACIANNHDVKNNGCVELQAGLAVLGQQL